MSNFVKYCRILSIFSILWNFLPFGLILSNATKFCRFSLNFVDNVEYLSKIVVFCQMLVLSGPTLGGDLSCIFLGVVPKIFLRKPTYYPGSKWWWVLSAVKICPFPLSTHDARPLTTDPPPCLIYYVRKKERFYSKTLTTFCK